MVLPVGGRKPGIPDRTGFELNTILSPGDEGDLKASVGGQIRDVKPGRIDARVRGLSTAASVTDNRTILNTLVEEAAPSGAEVWVPEGEFPADGIEADSHVRIRGNGTLKAPTSDATSYVVRIPQGTSDIIIEGITVDGSEVTRPIQIGESSSGTEVEQVTIRGVTVANAPTTGGDLRLGINGNRARHVVVENCIFRNLFSAINVRNMAYWTIRNNTFEDTTGHNAIYMLWDANIIDEGRGIVIVDNVMRNLTRMGVELWSASGSTPIYEPLVARNHIELASTGTMGISSITAHRAVIADNTIRRGEMDNLGIEHSGEFGTIVRNRVTGFQTAVALDGRGIGNHFTLVADNLLTSHIYGVTLANTDTGVSGERILRNRIIDSRDFGITVGRNLDDSSPSTRYFGEWEIAENYVERRTAMDGDGSRTWFGIALGPARGFGRCHHNWVVQGMASPASGMTIYPYYAPASMASYPNEVHYNIAVNRAAVSGYTYSAFEANTTGGNGSDLVGNKAMDSSGSVSDVSVWS